MEKKKLDWIISLIREDMGAGAVGAPTNHTGRHVAEFSPVMVKIERRKKPTYMKLPAGMRKRWKKRKRSHLIK